MISASVMKELSKSTIANVMESLHVFWTFTENQFHRSDFFLFLLERGLSVGWTKEICFSSLTLSRTSSSCSQMFFKIVVLKNIAIFKGKRQCWSPFLIKLQAWMKTYHFIKKRLQHRCFPVNIRKFLITSFFTEHLWWLLLQNLPYVNPVLHKLLKW